MVSMLWIQIKRKTKKCYIQGKTKGNYFQIWSPCKDIQRLEKCEGYEFSAILVELTEPYCKGGGAEWSIRRLDDFKKNPECSTEKRIINIEKKTIDKKGKEHYVVLDEV